MRQTRVETIIARILEIQYELESIRRCHEINTDTATLCNMDGDIRTSIGHMSKAVDELVYVARAESLTKPVTMKDKVKRLIHG